MKFSLEILKVYISVILNVLFQAFSGSKKHSRFKTKNRLEEYI